MKKVKLKSGHKATVYHAGTDSYYDATIIRPVSRQELVAVSKVTSGEDPRPDATILRETLASISINVNNRLIYNDFRLNRAERRLKIRGRLNSVKNLNDLNRIHTALKSQFGDRLLDVGLTDPPVNPPMWQSSLGGELYIRLKAY